MPHISTMRPVLPLEDKRKLVRKMTELASDIYHILKRNL